MDDEIKSEGTVTVWVKHTATTSTSLELRTLGLLEAVMTEYLEGHNPNPDAHTLWRIAEWFGNRYGSKNF